LRKQGVNYALKHPAMSFYDWQGVNSKDKLPKHLLLIPFNIGIMWWAAIKFAELLYIFKTSIRQGEVVQ
jgi:hypothetical protein